MAKPRKGGDFQYDVCLSFAGAQRRYVKRVADLLRKKGVRVFFDKYETAELWGRDLYSHLDEVYQHMARYCILFASKAYAAAVWTNHERKSAQARALQANREYILPARFDKTPIPGIPDTVHYINLATVKPRKLAEIILKKIGGRERRDYLPPVPDKLFERLDISADAKAKDAAHGQAASFLNALRRMSEEERAVVLKLVWYGCPTDLPKNVHINLDFLRRLTGKTPARIKLLLGNLRSLGFTCRVRSETHNHHRKQALGQSEMVELEWLDLTDESEYPALVAAYEMVNGATDGYCEVHGWQFLERLDFSQLASATATREVGHALPNVRFRPTASVSSSQGPKKRKRRSKARR